MIECRSSVQKETETEPENTNFDLRNVITKRLREAKIESMKGNKTPEGKERDSFYIHQFKNKTGFLVHAQPGKPTDYCRVCEICNKRYKDMKQHTITSHVTNNWWGTFGYSICWNCQEYQFVGEIKNQCNGEFNSALHKEAFLFRFNCFERYIKEELGCKTDHKVVTIIRREGMCDRSYSGFTPNETPFLTLIDLSTNLETQSYS